MKDVEKFLEGREVYVHAFSLEVSEAEPFVFDRHSHSRPGPSFAGWEYTDYLSDGSIDEVETGSRYDYPCFDDHDYKVAVSSWTWLLLYWSRKYATDDDESRCLRLIVKSESVAEPILEVIRGIMGFGLQESKPSETKVLSAAVAMFDDSGGGVGDLKRAVKKL